MGLKKLKGIVRSARDRSGSNGKGETLSIFATKGESIISKVKAISNLNVNGIREISAYAQVFSSEIKYVESQENENRFARDSFTAFLYPLACLRSRCQTNPLREKKKRK